MLLDAILILFGLSILYIPLNIFYHWGKSLVFKIQGKQLQEQKTVVDKILSFLTGFYYITNMPVRDWKKEPEERKISSNNKVGGYFKFAIITLGFGILLVFVLQGVLIIAGEPIDIGKSLAEN